ncbi:ABC transporter permease [Paenibacillus nasutitermitis]|uniref:Sugar ABC transporter permease n=1 Tax=Paenibacillus nasutitermitis TaxID=1652958 RepID=A0A917DUP7_9BACL|nr:ABC transporter permease subunit [Paenibacillus nasutitermitis]GGD72828.1 sugar ABC transporter permease [Paenibacillus nasutitermitis]
MQNVDNASKPVRSRPGRRSKVRYRTLLSLYALFAPTAILLIVFNYIPIYGIIIAFKDYSVFKGIMASDWVGLKHFKYFLNDDKFWIIFRNTLVINFYDLLFGFSAPILFALLANELYSKKFKRSMQTISYLPHFLSWIVVSGIFYSILSPQSGLFNHFLEWFGFEPIYFMTEPSLFRGLLVFAEIWKNVGWAAILYFAVIAGIDTNLYEAAWIDGASRWRQVIHITIPHLVPMIMLLFLLRLASIFDVGFERIFLMQNPLVYDVSDVISTYVYRVGLEQSQFSLTTAIGLTQSLLAFLLLIISNRLAKKLTGLGLY